MVAAQWNQRRAPSQARAQATCAAILEATTRILEELGEAALTTNRIADRAGVSIGTLYQYYPNKQAILVAIGRRENACMDAVAAEFLAAGVSERRARIRAYVGALSDRPATRRAVLKAMLESEPADVLWPAGPESVDAYVMSRAVIGAVRAAVLENSPYLQERSFEDALVRLVAALQAPSPHPPFPRAGKEGVSVASSPCRQHRAALSGDELAIQAEDLRKHGRR